MEGLGESVTSSLVKYMINKARPQPQEFITSTSNFLVRTKLSYSFTRSWPVKAVAKLAPAQHIFTNVVNITNLL